MSDLNRTSYNDFLALARLALSDRPQDVQLFLSRAARRLRQDSPEVAEQLAALLRNAPSRNSPLRRENAVPLPVDNDSRLHLIRVENPSPSMTSPIFSAEVGAHIDSLICERKAERKLRDAGLDPTRSALFVGPPGLGKTMTARWIATQLSLPLLVLDLSAVMSSFLGRTGNNVRSVLDYAKKQNCVLLLDELDAIAKRRDDATEIGELKRLVTVLLQEIDEWPADGILIAATNHPELLDPAVWRRFDRVVEFPRPTRLDVVRAIESLLRDEDGLDAEWIDVMSVVLSKKNYSEIAKQITALRRAAILTGSSLVSQVERYVTGAVSNLDHTAKIELGRTLDSVPGISQRRASEITGVSRDTLRKKSTNVVKSTGRSRHGR